MRVILLAFLAFVPVIVPAQENICTISISGNVIDEHDGSILSFAEIIIQEPFQGTVSDQYGKYRLENICPGTYEIVCRHIGCEPVSINVAVTSDTIINFYPEHHAELLRKLEVVAYSEPENNASEKSLGGQQLIKSKGRSLAEVTDQINGASTLESGSNIEKPVVRGMHSNRLLIATDGVLLESQGWGSEHAPEIDPNMAGQIEVHTGVDALVFGPGGMGGAVEVVASPPPDSAGIAGNVALAGMTNGRKGTVSITTLGRGAGKLQRFYAGLNGTLSRSGNLRTPEYYLKNTGAREENFGWRAGYLAPKAGMEITYSQFNTELGIFSAAHTGSLHDLEKAIASDLPLEAAGFTYEIGRPYQHVEHETVASRFHWWVSDNTRIKLKLARQYNKRQEYDKDTVFSKDTDRPEVQFELTTHTADLGFEKSAQTWTFSGGAVGTRRLNTYEGLFFIPNYEQRQGGCYLGVERFWGKWQAKAIARYDLVHQRVFRFTRDSTLITNQFFDGGMAGIGIERKIGKHYTAGLEAGNTWRPPGINELYSNGLHHGAASIESGNESLDKEQAFFVITDFAYGQKNLNISASAYGYYFENYIFLRPDLPPKVTIRGTFPAFEYDQAPAFYRGIDVSARYAYKRFLIKGNASIIRADELATKSPAYLIPPDDYQLRLSYDLSKFLQRDREGKWEVYVEGRHVTKQWRVTAGRDYAPPPKAYSLANAGVSASLGKGIIINFTVLNIFNTPYRSYMDRFRYFADQKGRSFELRLYVPFQT